jgi:nucleotide-binding universal stress UspA family protein
MEDIKRILVVSRMTKDCRKAVHYGVSLSRKFGAELYVIHVVHDPILFSGWNLPIPSLQEEYRKTLREAKEDISAIVREEKGKGMSIQEIIEVGDPTEKILDAVKEKKIDLIVMLAHEEGRLEHFLFGRSNEEICRKMPCSIFLVKKEPEAVAF